MNRLLFACLVCVAGSAHADSFTSSASSAGSASSGSVSTSLRGSSDSSTSGRRDRTATYRIVDIVAIPERAGYARVALAGDDPADRVWLDLPRTVADREGLAPGDVVEGRPRVYGWAFAHGGARDPFFLVLADAWSDRLVARRVSS